MDGDAVRQVVLAFLYQPETAALIPPLLRQAKEGDLAPIAAQGILAVADIQAGMSRPLQLSVLCSEDVPLYADPAPGAPPTFLGNEARESLRDPLLGVAAQPRSTRRSTRRPGWRSRHSCSPARPIR